MSGRKSVQAEKSAPEGRYKIAPYMKKQRSIAVAIERCFYYTHYFAGGYIPYTGTGLFGKGFAQRTAFLMTCKIWGL